MESMRELDGSRARRNNLELCCSKLHWAGDACEVD
jgi:hypothetical protein